MNETRWLDEFGKPMTLGHTREDVGQVEKAWGSVASHSVRRLMKRNLHAGLG